MNRRASARLVRVIIALTCALILVGVAASTVFATQPPTDQPTPNPPDSAAPDLTGQPAQTGLFQVSFTERNPLSSIARMKARTRYATAELAPEYDLAEETFKVYVPASYDPEKTYGLIVWVSPGIDGSPTDQWLPVLDKHDLIWIGADNAGNERIGWYRFGLALDAAFNMKKRYSIDLQRCYISGMSGGGRIASRVGVAFADEFDGAFMIVGCDFYKRTPVPDDPGKFYIERYNPPTGRIFGKARRENRYVLLTGGDDFNRVETQAIYEQGFVKEHFAHVTYLEVPAMGHALPDADWFEKGVVALDEPLEAMRAEEAQRNQQREEKAAAALAEAVSTFEKDPVTGYLELVKVADGFEGTESGRQARVKADAFAADPANDALIQRAKARAEASQLLLLAESYIKAGRPDLAREKLNRIIEILPDSDLATTAKQRLADLDRR